MDTKPISNQPFQTAIFSSLSSSLGLPGMAVTWKMDLIWDGHLVKYNLVIYSISPGSHPGERVATYKSLLSAHTEDCFQLQWWYRKWRPAILCLHCVIQQTCAFHTIQNVTSKCTLYIHLSMVYCCLNNGWSINMITYRFILLRDWNYMTCTTMQAIQCTPANVTPWYHHRYLLSQYNDYVYAYIAWYAYC